MVTTTMAAGTFKGRCLRVMDEVQSTRQPVVITKHGRPVAKLVPADDPPPDLLGCLTGVVEIVEELLREGPSVAPAAVSADWKVW